MTDAPAPANSAVVGSSRTRRVGAMALGIVVALLVAEAGLRLFGLGGPPTSVRMLRNEAETDVLYHCYASNPNGEFRPLPDVATGPWRLSKKTIPPVALPLDRASETPWCVEYRNGTFAVRGPAVTPAPLPGVLRVIGTGDSFAYGDGVPAEKTLFAQLDALLGPGVEVLNCGRSGANVELSADTLRWARAKYGGSRGLFVFIPNDVVATPALQSRLGVVYDLISMRAEHSAAEPWYAASRIGAAIAHGARVRRISQETLAVYRDMYDPAHNRANLQALEARFHALARTPGARIAVVIYPLMYGLEDGYPLTEVHEKVADMARQAGLPVLDLAPHFAGRDSRALRVHDADHHPNGTAHGIAAEAVAAWLRADVPGFVGPR